MVNIDRLLLVAILVFGVASTATLYSMQNRIEVLESRLAAPEIASAIAGRQGQAAVEQLAALTGAPRGGPQLAVTRPPAPAEAPPQLPLGSVEDMIVRLDARLKQNPKDAEGWRMLGWSYFQTARYDESALAYAKAIEVNPSVAAYKSARGEALVKAAGNVVTGEAKQLFDRALALDPKDPKARFFDGLVKVQAGDKTAALEEWTSLANELGSDSPLVPDLAERISALRWDIGVDLSSRVQKSQPAVSSEVPGSSSGPQYRKTRGEAEATKADERAAVGAKGSSDQSAMIKGMVDGLAGRLEQSPRDADGWMKLMRSQTVLGEADKARQSRDRALKIFEDSPQDQARIAAEARELGLAQ